MKEWLIASSLAMAGGGAYYSGALDTADVVRTVNKPPSVVYDGFKVVLNDYSPDLYQFAALAPDPEKTSGLNDIKFDVKSEEDKSIDYTLLLKDRPIVNIKVAFSPLDNGQKTKVAAEIDVHEMPQIEGEPPMAMPGGQRGFDKAVTLLVNKLIENIENGKIAEWDSAMTALRGEIMSHPEFAQMRLAAAEARREMAMSEASRPMVDPSEAAVNPVGVSAAPAVDVSR
jgi:phenylpyruvate tautomerase PptA (4-oxalocrotonate tautomerase family)